MALAQWAYLVLCRLHGEEAAIHHGHGLRVTRQRAVGMRLTRESDRVAHTRIVHALDGAVQEPTLAGAQLLGLNFTAGKQCADGQGVAP